MTIKLLHLLLVLSPTFFTVVSPPSYWQWQGAELGTISNQEPNPSALFFSLCTSLVFLFVISIVKTCRRLVLFLHLNISFLDSILLKIYIRQQCTVLTFKVPT